MYITKQLIETQISIHKQGYITGVSCHIDQALQFANDLKTVKYLLKIGDKFRVVPQPYTQQ
jgi:hypothetical protein